MEASLATYIESGINNSNPTERSKIGNGSDSNFKVPLHITGSEISIRNEKIDQESGILFAVIKR